MKRGRIDVGALVLAIVLWFSQPVAAEEPEAEAFEETMLMFVGEAVPVVTVASRHPESPATAPAMVTVVGREEIERRGYQTLAELLAAQPGFFMAAGGRGTVPYLRGLRDAVLFLYDGVPITTDVTKSFAPLDREISLDAVDRVEIVRGPGSVLWGPDAFAGVVNIVPRRGRQRPGGEARLLGGTEDLRGATLSWGESRRGWDAFLSLSGVRERFYSPDFTAEGDEGAATTDSVDASSYAEIVGTLHYGDWLHLTGRWSDYTRRYTMGNVDGDLSWAGAKEAPVNLLKATASRIYGSSHYTLSGFLQETDYLVRDADFERRQENRVTHVELLWDRRVLTRGLLTAGASWRRNSVHGAVVRDGFLPDFLAPDPLFVPTVDQADFTNELASAFGQFRYQWGKTEWWAGGRRDDHSQYRTTWSYSLGLHRPLSETLRFKATWGTAFRSPYSSQLFNNEDLEPEEVRTASVQLAWQPGAARLVELTLFHSRLDHQRSEDPYGGLSLPSGREVYGAELAGRAPVSRSVSVNAGLSLNGGDGGDNYRVLRFSFFRPDGSQVTIFDEWDEPVDRGPKWLATLGLVWRLGPEHTLAASARTGGKYRFSYQKGTDEGSYYHPLLVDLTYRRPGFVPGRDSLTLRVTNLLDQDYQLPDIFGPTDGPPLQATLMWECRF